MKTRLEDVADAFRNGLSADVVQFQTEGKYFTRGEVTDRDGKIVDVAISIELPSGETAAMSLITREPVPLGAAWLSEAESLQR